MEIEINENKVKVFKENHVCGPYLESSSKGHYYKITPSSIGYSVEVVCNRCGKSYNLTKYDTW